MKTSKLCLAILILYCNFSTSIAAESIPPQFTGVWQDVNSIAAGSLTSEYVVLFLGEDGTGSFIGGPPRTDMPMKVSFDSNTNALQLDFIVDGVVASSMNLLVDPGEKSLSFELQPSFSFRRISTSAELSDIESYPDDGVVSTAISPGGHEADVVEIFREDYQATVIEVTYPEVRCGTNVVIGLEVNLDLIVEWENEEKLNIYNPKGAELVKNMRDQFLLCDHHFELEVRNTSPEARQ